MKPAAQTAFAERAGRALGRMWRGSARTDRKARAWLTQRGAPAGAATSLLWIIKLVVLGALVYFAFWLALLLAFAVTAAWLARNADADDKDQPEWREGHGGFGLYDKNEWRHDMGDPDEP